MTTTVGTHHCGQVVYQLDGTDGPVVLDPHDDPLGIWTIDGTRARRLTNVEVLRGAVGYRLHECPDALFDLGDTA